MRRGVVLQRTDPHPDGDGINNLQEYLAGTVPTNSTSGGAPQPLGPRTAPIGLQVSPARALPPPPQPPSRPTYRLQVQVASDKPMPASRLHRRHLPAIPRKVRADCASDRILNMKVGGPPPGGMVEKVESDSTNSTVPRKGVSPEQWWESYGS